MEYHGSGVQVRTQGFMRFHHSFPACRALRPQEFLQRHVVSSSSIMSPPYTSYYICNYWPVPKINNTGSYAGTIIECILAGSEGIIHSCPQPRRLPCLSLSIASAYLLTNSLALCTFPRMHMACEIVYSSELA